MNMFKHFMRQLLAVALLTIASVSVFAEGEETHIVKEPLYIRVHPYWWDDSGLAEMYKASDYNAETNVHLCRKGLIATNLKEGTFFNFRCGGTTDGDCWYFGPRVTDKTTKSGEKDIKYMEIEEGSEYELSYLGKTADKADQTGFVLPKDTRQKDNITYLGAMLQIDVWIFDGTARVKVQRIENPKLFVAGNLATTENLWKLEDYDWFKDPDHPKPELTETYPGSMIYKGVITTDQENANFTLYAPRIPYNGGSYGWQGQRLTSPQSSPKGTTTSDEFKELTNEDTWYIGMDDYLNTARGGWKIPHAGTYVITADLRDSNGRSSGNKLMLQNATQTVAIGSAHWATFAPKFNVSTEIEKDVDDANVELFYVTGRQDASDVLIMPTITSSTLVEGEGILIQSDKDVNVTFTYTEGDAQKLDGNKLIGVTAPTIRPDDDDLYLLANKNNHVAFYKWKKPTDKPLAAYKCYLRLGEAAANIPEFLDFEERETNIETLNTSMNQEECKIFTLLGQRIGRLQHGVNIVNGKKVLF